jgi:uncharacterized protein (DUF1800 family)
LNVAFGAAAVSAKLTPATAQINLLGTATFTLSNVPTTTQVTWQLVSTAAGSTPDSSGALGTVDSSGHYKAPSALPKVPTVSLQVVDHSTPPNLLASAAITLVDTVKVSPATASVRLGASQTFTASGVPAGLTIAWKVVGAGAIDTSGKYTAPAAMPASNSVTIQAVDSTNASNVLATATVTLLNPIPAITGFSPSVLNVNLNTTLEVVGTGFVPGSVLQFDGQTVPSTYKSATEIDYAAAPTATATHAVTVLNPTPDGKTSNSVTLTIKPAVSVSLTPNGATVRGGAVLKLYAAVENNPNQALTFTVNGVAGTNGVLGGNATVGTVATDTTGALVYNAPATLPGATVTIAAQASVDPHATASITVNLENPTPVITSVSPPAPFTIGSTQTLTIAGTGFVSGSTVSVGGVAFTPAYKSPTSLTATGTIPAVPAFELAITVSNPAPGPITSAPFEVAEASSACTASDKTQCLTYAEAVRFLEMATWGPTPDSIAHLQNIGRAAWLAEQFAMPSPNPAFPAPVELTEGAGAIQTAFFNRALNDPDQLRQRVAFALSEIFVVSAVKDTNYEAMRRYMQDLTDNAFGSYRNLLGVITLDPAMGWFLDMVNNDKANPSKDTVANENYAREVMQLISIGLTVLTSDGIPTVTPTYDDNCIPSTQPNAPVCLIPEMAKVFTGWTYAPQPPATGEWTNPQWFEAPMVAFEDHHDETQKNISIGGQLPCTILAGGSALSDLNAALDCLSNHPNVPPFISYRLIQRLVKSNPSPAYVGRIASVFLNDGKGNRGNLQAVVTAILTDSEAVTDPSGAADANAPAGKLREPVFYATSLLRALNASASSADGVATQSTNMGEQVLYAPSVFNYFSPFYRIPSNGVVAPEFQIQNASSALARLNFAYFAVTRGTGGNLKVDLSGFAALPSTVSNGTSPLIDAIGQALYHGEMAAEVRAALVTLTGELVQQKATAMTTAQTLIYFAAIAPQYQVQQ